MWFIHALAILSAILSIAMLVGLRTRNKHYEWFPRISSQFHQAQKNATVGVWCMYVCVCVCVCGGWVWVWVWVWV